jgi:hypothetical protein
MFITDNIQSLSAREEEGSAALLIQSAYMERPIPALLQEEIPLPSRDKGDTQTHSHERDHISLL